MAATRLLNDWIEGYLNFTEGSEIPYLFRKWVAMSIIASTLQKRCYLPWGPLTFYPNLYVVLVSPTEKDRMSTSISLGVELIHRVGIDVKLFTYGMTRTSLVEEISTHPALTVYTHEFALLKNMAYDLADWYDCRDNWKYKNKTISNICINLLAATSVLSAPSNAIEAGMNSRSILVYEEDSNKTVPLRPADNRDLESQLVSDLRNIAELSGEFYPTGEFINDWKDWYLNLHSELTDRQPLHVMKLCMVLSASRDNTKIIDSSDLAMAIKSIEKSEANKERLTNKTS